MFLKKHDRQGARTVPELDRRYNVKKAMGAASSSLVAANDAKTSVDNKIDKTDALKIIELINSSDALLNLIGKRIRIESENFTLTEDGAVEAKNIILRNENGVHFVDISDGIVTVSGGKRIVQETIWDFPLMNFKAGDHYYAMCARCDFDTHPDGSYDWIPRQIVFRTSDYESLT